MADPKNDKPQKEPTVAQAMAELARTTVAPPSVPKDKRPAVTVVKLTKHFNNNMAGEVCGFAPDVAKQLIEIKAAEKV